ncbi:GNAT family N-acetyltransferase [Maritalea sp.]|uniref:GNAT family N-acetyltransferase n=1 Tax=Maritalea sp. TaxID=2003361 RepID=UPI003EF0EAF4
MILAETRNQLNSDVMPEGQLSVWKPMFTVTSDINDVEPQWRALERFGLQSPGQSFDFVRSWIEQHEIPKQKQFFVTAYFDKQPFVVLPLLVTRRLGATVLTWFVGSHVACNAPLINQPIMAKLSDEKRQRFWRELLQALPPSDAVYLPGIPTGEKVEFEAFEGQGNKPVCDYVYRSKFEGWEEADKSQRDRKRRRRDKQHRQKLDALGEVKLVKLEKPAEVKLALTQMFEQKRKRFEQLDIENPFADETVRKSYFDVFKKARSVTPIFYALYLDDELIASRYCIAHGKDLFMLISSMSTDEEVMVGSPGNQCLLEILKSELDQENGYTMVDIGVGESDEKRRWCNELQPVCNRFIPRTVVGWGFMALQTVLQKTKYAVKTNKTLFNFYKSVRGILPPILRT